jgi:hypothetical protein
MCFSRVKRHPPALRSGRIRSDGARIRIVRGDQLLDQAAHTVDNNHLNEAGDLVLRDAALAAIGAFFGTSLVSYYDLNGLTPLDMGGTAGTIGAGATGQVPTGWQGSGKAATAL